MTEKMRFHILGLPHTVTSKEYNACAYTQKVLKFGKMMKARGHEIIHYGHEESNLVCDEHVTVVTNKDLEIAYGNYDWRKNFFTYNTEDHAYQTFYKNAITEIGKRKQKHDFILPFWGSGVRAICDAHQHDMIVVEPGIGYAGGHWARWKVFESYAIMHAYYGMQGVGNCQSDWYDVVIPNYFDPEDFTYNDKKEDYMLFLGRVYSGKGVHIAIQASEAAGCKLVIAGQKPDDMHFPKHVEFVGYADVPTRKKLMANAKGAYVPSMYIEPFGGVQIEMLMSGTPTITTDWGSFVENNLHGVTGYRCRTFDHFVWATENITNIKPQHCRTWAENFTLEHVAPMYEEYFQNVLNVYNGKGWYERNQQRYGLYYLHRKYPVVEEEIDYGKVEAEEKPMANRLALWVKTELDPSNVLDVGCGPGHFVESMNTVGLNCTGFDVDTRITNKPNLSVKSLFDNTDTAEVVLCIEVAEHIESYLNDQIVDRLMQATEKVLIFTAAQPGQGGIGHINRQYRQYWLDKFTNKGMIHNTEKEQQLLDCIRSDWHMGWFVNNLIVLYKP